VKSRHGRHVASVQDRSLTGYFCSGHVAAVSEPLQLPLNSAGPGTGWFDWLICKEALDCFPASTAGRRRDFGFSGFLWCEV